MVKCPDCGAEMLLRQTYKFVHRSGQPRKFYGCSRWPACTATHGAHPDGRPLGIPGDAETKLARIAAHDVFDKLWKSGKMPRRKAYLIIAQRLGLEELHIGECDKEMCKRIIEASEAFLMEKK